MKRPLTVALALAVLLTGACTVNEQTSQADPYSGGPADAQFRREHAVRYDLTVPRTAQELGVPAPRTSAIFDRTDSTFWKVDFALPGGRRFTDDKAIAVGVDTTYVPRSIGLDVVTVNSQAADLDELAGQLHKAVDQLGLDPADVSRYLEQARRPLTASNPDLIRVLTGKPIGFLTPTMEPRMIKGDATIAVNYTFTWDHPTGPSSSSTAPARG